jgi:hypothetical protein
MQGDEANAQIAELGAHVRHLQSDVTEIKTELRTTNQRIDALSKHVDERFGKVDGQIAGLKDALWSTKLWAIGLYVAQSGTMLLVMAHGFKWI